jgi:type IV secretory pathway TrbD component
MHAKMVFAAGLLVGAVGIVMDNLVALGLGIVAAFAGVLMMRNRP